MIDKTVLIIDDENQTKNFNREIKAKLKQHGTNVDLIFIDMSLYDVRDDDFFIDIDKFEKYFNYRISNKSIDIIACDYNLADKAEVPIKGTDLINIIRNFRKKTPIIMYSGNYEDIIKDVFDNYKNDKKTAGESIKEIKNLYNNNILDFIKRSDYYGKVNYILKKPPEKTDVIILDELRKYGEYKFKSAYTRFDGKTLNEIATEIDKNSYSGNEFLEEIIQQILSYIIETNSEK